MVIIPVVSVNCDPEFLHFHISQATAALEEKAKLEKSLKDLQELQGDQEVNTVQTPHLTPPHHHHVRQQFPVQLRSCSVGWVSFLARSKAHAGGGTSPLRWPDPAVCPSAGHPAPSWGLTCAVCHTDLGEWGSEGSAQVRTAGSSPEFVFAGEMVVVTNVFPLASSPFPVKEQ